MGDSSQAGRSSSAGSTAGCAIVVPCYNEAARLDGDAFLQYLAANRGEAIIFVNDGSNDGTLALLEKLRDRRPGQITVLNQKTNEGKAEAVRQGMLQALRMPEVTFVGYWDADLATPLSAVNEMLEISARQPEIEIVFGSRVRLLGRHIERQAVRHYLGRIFATFASMVLKLPIYDTQCGAKLFRITPDLSKVLGEPFHSRWIFDVELIARFLKVQATEGRRTEGVMYELPLTCWVDVPGSKVRTHDFLRAIRELWFIRRKYGAQRSRMRNAMIAQAAANAWSPAKR